MIHEPGNLPLFPRVLPAGCPGALGSRLDGARFSPLRASAGASMTHADPDPTPAVGLAPMVLYVCTTCRDADHVVGQDVPCAGARLFAALGAAPVDPAVTIVPVECLSACKRSCAASFSAPGKWTYVYGDLPAEAAAAMLLQSARLYAEAPDGLIPWKIRPDALKKGVLARVPAVPASPPR